jgi:hypothetical protein
LRVRDASVVAHAGVPPYDSIMTNKICSTCGIEKPLIEFPRDKKYRDGHRGQCIKCRSARNREYEKRPGYVRNRKPAVTDRKMRDTRYRRKYGITHDDYDRILLEHGHKCALCSNPPEKSLNGRLAVDHCHATGVVRGLLCTDCNVRLSKWGDNVAGITRVLAYVSRGG